VNVENEADLDLLQEAPSGLLLTAEDLLRVHGGSCIASSNPLPVVLERRELQPEVRLIIEEWRALVSSQQTP
jgi:hypothetical protein